MVHESAALGIWFTLFASFMVPILAVVIFTLRNKKKGIPGAWIAGAIGFYISQIMLRFPILNLMSDAGVLRRMQSVSLVLYALFLALTAALFETTARFAVAKIIEKRGLSYKRSIAAGMGHGGLESMILIGLTYVSNLTYIAMIGNGTFDQVVEEAAASGVDVTELLAAKDALINTSGFIFALAGYERLVTMVFHVFLSVLICYFVIQKQSPKGFVLCFLAHGFVDFVTGYVSTLSTEEAGSVLSQNTVYAICYIFLTAVAVLAVYGCYRLYPDWDRIRNRTA